MRPSLAFALLLPGFVALACAASHPPEIAAAPCTDTLDATYVAPGALPPDGGHVLRCAHDGALAAAEVDRIARTAGYTGEPLSSGASILRVLYRTERGSDPPQPGFSSGVVLLPDHPLAAKVPAVVVAHGTVGEAPSCPPSQESPRADGTYLAELGYALVGAGYAVILTDFAGYAGFGAPGNPPSGYHSAADEAKSVLDAARALRAVQPSLFTGDTVLVGHSQGGHAVLSALALAATYGDAGTLVGVVAYAPSWFSMASFGAMLARPADFPLATQYDTAAASLWYHYSHAELLDGPGAGPPLFEATKRDAIRKFFEQGCDPRSISSLGTTVADLFDPGFVNDVAIPAALASGCTTDSCRRWLARYDADRPHLTGSATRVPVLVVYGDADDWIPAERETCGFDRLLSDGANATVCIVPGAKHDPVVGARAQYVSGWIGSKALGRGDPGACGPGREALHDSTGAVASCATPPPND